MSPSPQPSPSNPRPAPPFSLRVLAAAALIAGVAVLLVFLWYATYVLLLLFAGILLGIFLTALADGVKHLTRLGDRASIAIVLVLVPLILIGVGALLAPSLLAQVEQLTEQVPQSLQALEERLDEYRWGRWLLDGLAVQDVGPVGPEVLMRATGVVSTTIGAFISIVVILFVGIYLAVAPSWYASGVLYLLPRPYRPRGGEVLAALGYTLRWWLIGQLIAMTSVGIMTALGLWLLGVPMALTLGLLAFALDFVPNFGPILAMLPAVLLALVDSPTKAVYVLILYFVVQQIESFLISPLVHQRTVLLPPVLTIAAQVLLGVLVGPLGLLLATPLTAVVLVLVKMLYVEQVLGDEVDTPDDHIDVNHSRTANNNVE